MSNTAELSSLTTALDEMTKRVTAMADSFAAHRREDLANELYAVERQLANAVRRLGKVVDSEA